MVSIGITGQSGFVGTHLFNYLGEFPELYKRVPFEDTFFEDDSRLRAFVKQCDVIVHLAAMMRSPVEGEVYRVNMKLTHQLIGAMEAESVTPCLLFSSSIQEGNGSEYGRCKLESRELLMNWAKDKGAGFGGMIFPNLFGPGARPFSHSFIATFCYQLTHNETPKILVDNNIELKYIFNLMKEIKGIVDLVVMTQCSLTCQFRPDFNMKVTEVLNTLSQLAASEKDGVELTKMSSVEKCLLDTLISYKNY